MTVLTGQNGSGKTTILNTLSRHFGWDLQLVSTPLAKSSPGPQQEWSDVWPSSTPESGPLPGAVEVGKPWPSFTPESGPPPGAVEVGKITYTDGAECRLLAPPQVNQAQYRLTYQHLRSIQGIHIPSHRPSFAYHRMHSIPVDPRTSQQQYSEYQGLLQSFYTSEQSQNPGRSLKQSLIALAVFGYGNDAVTENLEFKQMFLEFQDKLRLLLPRNLGFHRLEVRMPDIVFVADSGDFSLDAASGGVGALVGIAWQIFMYGHDKTEFVVTIDEPENHLHPSMQRELLPNLFRAFPGTQFIVATHSPFIAASAPEAHVYALSYSESRRVRSSLLETAELSGTANEVLREVLGVSMTVPIWVESRFEEILDKYKNCSLGIGELRQLKADLIESRLIAYLPEALARVGR